MMSVKILGFGSNWWARFGRNPKDPRRYTRHAAYYNSAGVRCGNKMNRHWVVPGLVRFNGVGDFDPHFPNRAIGEIFRCPDPVFAYGGNRVLFAAKAANAENPDCYLVVVCSNRHGVANFDDPGWKSQTSCPVAESQLDDRQEALLLMETGDWVRTSLGIWQLRVGSKLTNGASLEIVEDDILA